MKFVAVSCLHAPITSEAYFNWLLRLLEEVKPDIFINLGDWYEGKAAKRWPSWSDEKWDVEDEHAEVARQAREINSRVDGQKIWMWGNHDDNLFGNQPDRLPKDLKRSVHYKHHVEVSDALKDWKIIDQYTHDTIYRIGQITLQHGCAVGDSAEKDASYIYGVPYGLYICGHCFDDETELLTRSGWKKQSDLSVGDLACTFNKQSGKLEWNAIEWINRYEHDGELVDLESKCISLSVTGQHGLYTSSAGSAWRDGTADSEFGKQRVFRCAGEMDSPGINASIAQIRALAWVIAEGSLEREGKALRISQSDAPDGRMSVLRKDLADAGFEWTEAKRYDANTTVHGQHRNYDAYRFNVSNMRDLGWMFEFIGPDKIPTEKMYGMNAAQASEFLDAYVWADGCVNKSSKNSRQIGCKDKRIVDFIQFAAAISGHRTSVIQRVRGSSEYSCITVNSRPTTSVSGYNWSKRHYTGNVWCVSVKNGTLLVRRNGHTAVTLNTHRPLGVTRAKERKTPLPYWYANPGCGADYSRMHYMDRLSKGLWGRGAIVGEVSDSSVSNSKAFYGSPQWSAELRIQEMAH